MNEPETILFARLRLLSLRTKNAVPSDFSTPHLISINLNKTNL